MKKRNECKASLVSALPHLGDPDYHWGQRGLLEGRRRERYECRENLKDMVVETTFVSVIDCDADIEVTSCRVL